MDCILNFENQNSKIVIRAYMKIVNTKLVMMMDKLIADSIFAIKLV